MIQYYIILTHDINLPGSCPKNGKTFKRKAEKERAEKLLEAAKAEAISRVRYLTDFLISTNSSTDCHVEIPMVIDEITSK